MPCCRREFAACPERIVAANRPEDVELFNLKNPDVSLHDTCNFRSAPLLIFTGLRMEVQHPSGNPSSAVLTCFCVCRYPMYIESQAWVTNLKQKLACGSILISNKMEYYEFFTRALKPGVHYVEVDANNLCIDTADKVRLRLLPSFLPSIAVQSYWRPGFWCVLSQQDC